MIHKPYRFRDKDDDYAPIDYSYVPSVSEGRRREQQKNIPKEPGQAVVRHRANPYDREAVDAYGTRAPYAPRARRASAATRLPSLADGPAPAARIAYPQGERIPENPYDPSSAEEWEGWREEPAEEAPIVAEDGSQYDPPAMAQLPEWYRVAQQNVMPSEERLRRPPRVQAAPAAGKEQPPQTDILGRPIRRTPPPENQRERHTRLYEDAGYPQELLERQRELEEEQERILRRRRHGAQYAVQDKRQEEYEESVGARPAKSRASYPPPREEAVRRRALTEQEREARRQAAYGAMAGEESLGRSSAYEAATYEEPRYQRRGPLPEGFAYEEEAENPYAAMEEEVPRRVQNRRTARTDRPLAYLQETAPNPYASAYETGGAPARSAAKPYNRRINEPFDELEEEPEGKRLTIPWLGIATFAIAFLAVALWLMQMSFTTRAQQAIQERQQAEITLRNSRIYEYRDLIEREAAKNNLNPAFVAAIVFNESTFRSGAESNVGARGLMQVMEATAADIGEELAVANYSFDMLYDAETNVTFGCYYLGKLSERFRGDPVLVSAAYHAGATQVQNWLNSSAYSNDGQTLLLENMADGPTKQYATRVKRDFAIYQRLYYDDVEDDA